MTTDLQKQILALTLAIKVKDDELRFLLSELDSCQDMDDETKLRVLAELHRRLPGFVSLSTPNTDDVLKPIVETLVTCKLLTAEYKIHKLINHALSLLGVASR